MFKQFKGKKGFTLIELMIVVAIHRDLGGYRHPELPAVSDEVAPVRGEDQPPGDPDLVNFFPGRKGLLCWYCYAGACWDGCPRQSTSKAYPQPGV